MRLPFLSKALKGQTVDLSKSDYQEEHRMLALYLEQSDAWRKQDGTHFIWGYDPSSVEASVPILKRTKEAGGRMMTAIGERLANITPISQHDFFVTQGDLPFLYSLATMLSCRQPEFTPQQIQHLLMLSMRSQACSWTFGKDSLTSMIVGAAKRQGLTPEIKKAIDAIIEAYEEETRRTHLSKEDQRSLARLRAVRESQDPNAHPLNEPWQAPLATEETRLLEFIRHCATASGKTPSEKWKKVAAGILARFETNDLLALFEQSLAGVRKMEVPVDAAHSSMLRGYCWMIGLIKSPRAAFLLGEMLLACNHKLTGFGARSQKGFSACVIALEQMGEVYALAELSKARAKVKTPSLADHLLSTLNHAAAQQNISLEELEEIILPTFELDVPGIKNLGFGDSQATLEIVGTSEVELRWTKAGKPVKSAPAHVKAEFKQELAELTRTKKEIESALSAQKARLESLFMIDRSWPYPLWRERHIDHPLMANMTRRLVWRFLTAKGEVLGIATDGVPLDIEDKPIEGLDENAEVRLWHPLDAGVSAVEAWREYIVDHEIRQPFKQAHREVYILTDAERTTGIYSNRFAAHVLKQHQCAALMRARGWRYQLQGWFDSQSIPTLALRQHGLRAEYFVEVSENDPAMMTSESGIATYVISDQLRFLDLENNAVRLDEIPAKVFSEVLRDVDLFVGVCSVGNDASWFDQGERMGFGAYWQSFSFGDLSATAETRKAILGRLLPRLSLANVAHIDGRFLVVRGKRRTYKIHLGSSNILMEPNDQYLCIVSAPDKELKTETIYLPFEGDRTMAVILSKALMLADDDKIKDPTILSQLER
ncbi:MAG: DUF4132 domain-containing protein [Fimbriimonadaceae bacterium]|nr:DUF4132 domain-containing protein [Fimbriimonadaceae bacterium]